MRLSVIAGAALATALGVRVVRSRHRRFLHPDGRSYRGDLEVWGSDTGAALIDRPGRHPVTVRISKGAGTKPGRADVLGLTVRVHGDERDLDLLLSTCGQGRFTRHVPMPRHSFDTMYGSILAYRTGADRKIYLSARPDEPLGDDLDAITSGQITLMAGDRAFGRVTFGGGALPARTDAELAFDPVRNTAPDLHPTGAIHGSRALAYRLSQRWRGAGPVRTQPRAVARTALNR
ncbi:hypothetical protein [Paractinoplanes brasiliensis]|uniref:Phosphodiesterase n=1 Tax=Paractinoplanes brasiliensis TaxID=52695 RepID=A0A4R6JXE1_9ACTN|nr:hypothetical protein [Actinoplanes brasiliensis]TDO41460.1 hypothetical protein C8E87_5193 [Actinoplanes brasiliensis]GID27254.1 hypothetical protein Abr02nite_22370 [Actinoplanes brasiliensis]